MNKMLQALVDTRKHTLDLSGKETVLIVDDEMALRSVLTYALSEFGYRVLEASNGLQALDVLESNEVDLVISDITMPEMDGFELVENIHKLYPNMLIQLVSGYSDKVDEDVVLHKKLLYKPYNINEMLQRIRKLLDQHQ